MSGQPAISELAPLRPLVPREPGESVSVYRCEDTDSPALAPLSWSTWVGLPARAPSSPILTPGLIPTSAIPADERFQDLAELALSIERSTSAVADAHAIFLENQRHALDQIEAITTFLASTASQVALNGHSPPPPVVH